MNWAFSAKSTEQLRPIPAANYMGQPMTRRPIAALMFADSGRAHQLAALLEAEGTGSRVVSSSDDLHRTLNAECIDLVILENDLKGFLSGLEIIERMHNDLIRPGVILMAEPAADTERRCRRMGLNRLLRNDIPLEELVPVASEVLGASLQQRVIIPAAARQLVRDASFVQPLPQMLIQLAGYLNRKEQDVKQLAKDISVDAKVASDLLRVTNSSAMGRPFKTTSIFDAVEFLGVRRAVSIALATGICAAKSRMLKAVSPKLRNWYNYRSVLIGSTAAAFAPMEKVSPPTAYLLGLLQDIGCLVLGSAFGERYDALLQRTQSIQHLCLEQVELNDFQTSHAEVSAALLQKWELPPSLIAMVFQHHAADLRTCSAVEQSFIRIMQIGEQIANLSECRLPRRHMLLNQSLAAYGKGRAQECRQALAMAIAQTVESSKVFQVPVPEDKELSKLLSDISTDFHRFDPARGEPDIAEGLVSAGPLVREGGVAEAPAATQEQDVPTAARPKLVAIDDEPTVLRLISRIVSALPLDVVECLTFEEASEALRDAAIVVCDVHLKGIEGHEIVQSIRARGLNPKIMMMSGDTRRNNVETCITLGIDDFLAKPFSAHLFIKKVRGLLADSPVQPASGT